MGVIKELALIRALVRVVATGLYFVMPLAALADAPCQMQQLAELPVLMVGGQPTLEVTINGKPARMLIDTGSDATLLFRRGAAQLGLALRPVTGVKFYGVGGSDSAMSARLTSLQLGNLVADNFDVFVIGREDMGPVQGVLGARFLTQSDVEFDFPDGKLRFFRPKNCVGDQVVYWGTAYAVASMAPAVDEGLYVHVALDGEGLVAQMDTGAGVSMMTPGAAAKVGVTPKSEGVSADGLSRGIGPEQVQTFVGVFPTFAFGDETIKNAKLRIADMFRAAREVPLNSRIAAPVVDEPLMLLGADFFQSHRVYVARGQRKVYVSYVGGPVFQTRTTSAAPVDQGPRPK